VPSLQSGLYYTAGLFSESLPVHFDQLTIVSLLTLTVLAAAVQ
jgi:hypothetical protein